MKYLKKLNLLLKSNGRKKSWVSHKMGIDRVTFWRKVSNDTFTPEQKKKIERIIKYNQTPQDLNLPNL